MVPRGSLPNPSLISLGEQSSVTEDDVFPETWVFTVVTADHESALRMLQTMRLFPGTIVGSACASPSVASNRRLSCGVTNHLLLNTTGRNPSLAIQIRSMIGRIRTVQVVRLKVECTRLCTRAPIVDFASGRTWYRARSRSTTRITLSRVEMRRNITAVELAALHHELAVESLRRFPRRKISGIPRTLCSSFCRG